MVKKTGKGDDALPVFFLNAIFGILIAARKNT